LAATNCKDNMQKRTKYFVCYSCCCFGYFVVVVVDDDDDDDDDKDVGEGDVHDIPTL
jgi:hypothetical protein